MHCMGLMTPLQAVVARKAKPGSAHRAGKRKVFLLLNFFKESTSHSSCKILHTYSSSNDILKIDVIKTLIRKQNTKPHHHAIIWQQPLLAQRKVFLLASIDMTMSGHSLHV